MAKDIFRYDYRQYGRDTGLSDKQIREEYSRLRDIAQKRIKRLSESEWTDTQTYLEHKEGFKKVADIPANQMKNALSDIYRFLHNMTSSVSGLNKQRRLAIETLHANGYKFVNKSNFKEFYDFMNDINNQYQEKYMQGSDIVADIFNDMKSRGISTETIKEDFEYWYKHKDDFAKVDDKIRKNKIAAPEEYTAEWYKAQFEEL